MQARMREYSLSEDRIMHLLQTEAVGRLATNGHDGYPYITPVHFVLLKERIYIHGLAAGEKIGNIKRNALVGFGVERMFSLLHHDELPCDTNTRYESVIARGHASLVNDGATRLSVLDAIVAKYAPQHHGTAYPQNMLKMTAVIGIDMHTCTGKFYSAQA